MVKRIAARILALMLTALLCIGMLPLSALAGSVTNYADFMADFKLLEVYADEFAAQSGKDPGELVLNYIRTGVERYQTGTWETLAGEEITAFTEYVAAQDAACGTTVADLRDIVIHDFQLPNGNPADFGHMFGTMNISYVASAVQSDDLSGWAGDLCDLLYYSVGVGVPAGTVDEMAAYIVKNCFGVDADDAFGWDDFYGDMDAYYLISEYAAGNGAFGALMDAYFTADLDDADRAAYFLNNRFKGVETADDVRTAIYNAYRTNVGIQVLEADRGISNASTLRQACCYAFADYLYSQAKDRLIGGGDEGGEEEEKPENGFYSVFSTTSSVLAPGITQDIKYAMSADGKQMVYYLASVDVTRDDVTIMANYKDNDPSKGWGMQRVEDQVAAMVQKHSHVENFTPVVATNGDGFNTTTGKPGGLLVMEGVEWHPVDHDGFFAILKDGTAMIGTQAEYEQYKAQIQEGIGAFGATLVKNGEIATADNGTRASRTAIGIKADGKVVMMVLDGRQEPFSCGGSLREIAQIMLEAGCVHAVNLDGGGSTTYMSKPEGSDNIKVINRPSDGYARSVAASLVAVSTAKSSKEFDRAIIQADYEYITHNTSIQLNAIGVNNIGSSAPIPEGAYWEVSDETVGTITPDGVFTASEIWNEEDWTLENADVTVSLMVDGAAVGSITLHVVVPDTLEFTEDSMNVIYDVPTALPFKATFNGNVVKLNEFDVFAACIEEDESYWDAALFEGFNVTAFEESGVRRMKIAAILINNEEGYDEMYLSMFRADEAAFDFENATAGNRTLAWLREVLNATTTDGMTYTAIDPSEDVNFNYTFALDMTAIEIPQQLADIVFMLPGSDNGNATAFNYMLQLAERVSPLTEVRITAQFDKDVEVDISELKVINEYFALKEATIDENNCLTLICNWIDQTQAIDPATANPVCILTGIAAKPADNAAWDGGELLVSNTGDVSYKIYLRASSLYSFAQQAENQQKYGLYPYSTDETGYEGGTENGAYFRNTYADFEDSFLIDSAERQGWYKLDGEYFYFVDHEAVTGVQYIPSREDESVSLFYNFDENGVCLGKVTGTLELDGALYYSINGERQTGWLSGYDADGNAVDYYFDPANGRAVDGVQTIDGYTYTFENNVLVRGDLVKTETGIRYRWAGKWLHGQWFQVDGNWYATRKYVYDVLTGYVSVQANGVPDWNWHLFDENGVFQSDYTGIYVHDGGEIHYLKNGVRDGTVGLVYENGYYYYISESNSRGYRNGTYWITKTHGMIPAGSYTFDEYGHITNLPAVEPDGEMLNGVKETDGVYYYYENGYVKCGAGVVKMTADGEEYYIYVRSNGQLAIGTYWITTTNGLLEAGRYVFDAQGRYYPNKTEEPDTPDVPAVKDGVVAENGALYYYVNGVLQQGLGVIKMTDDHGIVYYIYVRSAGELATGIYWPSIRNGLLEQGAYDWGTDGRYYPVTVTPDPDEPEEPDVKNGVYEENGVLRYYINGVWQKGNGVVQLTDEDGTVYYIYVRSAGELATGIYWPSIRNGLLEKGPHDFGTDGRYYPDGKTEEPEVPDTPETPEQPDVKNGIVEENGALYYYVNGVLQQGLGVLQFTEADGTVYYIYVRSSGQLATGIYWPSIRNNLLEKGPYDWGTDGKYYPAS
ncbi:MAG: hypothetical protein E7549_04075 [Ruminococcaceae bacterium]|nr:hypothetical protein [Oscillospiraceae bacterium]